MKEVHVIQIQRRGHLDSVFCFFASTSPPSSAARFDPLLSCPEPGSLPGTAAFGFFFTTTPFISDLTSFLTGLGGIRLGGADVVVVVGEVEPSPGIPDDGSDAAIIAAFFAASFLGMISIHRP